SLRPKPAQISAAQIGHLGGMSASPSIPFFGRSMEQGEKYPHPLAWLATARSLIEVLNGRGVEQEIQVRPGVGTPARQRSHHQFFPLLDLRGLALSGQNFHQHLDAPLDQRMPSIEVGAETGDT